MYPHLFSPLNLGGLTLKNRLTMAPLYLGYAGEDGTLSPLLLDHYRLMARSGVALVVVENATIDHQTGSAGARTLRADADEFLEGLTRLAAAIKAEGALASLQINHAGRFAGAAEPLAPSPVETFGRLPRAMSLEEIQAAVDKFADAARRVKEAGFDMVELHGGTGYLLASSCRPGPTGGRTLMGAPLTIARNFPWKCWPRSGRQWEIFPWAIASWRMNGCPTV